ncbi:MAG: EamA family transporter [Planctomycetota bacterium]|nr:EamA family transporter [Planctomycetota bacterium]
MPDPTPAAGSFTWFWFALLSAVFAALTNIFAKVGVAGIPSNLATWVRVVVILVVTSALVAANSEWANPLDLPRKTLLFLVLSGIATGASWLAYFKALQMAPASQVGPVDKLSVLLIMVTAVLFLGETLNWKQWVGGALILAGVILVAQKAPEQAASNPPATVAKAQADRG